MSHDIGAVEAVANVLCFEPDKFKCAGRHDELAKSIIASLEAAGYKLSIPSPPHFTTSRRHWWLPREVRFVRRGQSTVVGVCWGRRRAMKLAWKLSNMFIPSSGVVER